MTAHRRTATSSAGYICRLFGAHRLSGIVVVIAAALSLALSAPGTASAITTISQGYATSDTLSAGQIVSLQANTQDHVNAATTANLGGILGVVIGDGGSLLALSNGEDHQVQVATSGVVQVLVSDINGSINEGDQITASPIPGVGMKATASAKVVGIAQETLKASNGSKQTYKEKSGQSHETLIGQLPVLINVSYFYKQPEKTIIPSAVQNVANTFAGKKVSPLPILISSAIFMVTMIIVATIIYSMIRSSIISVGRNPMSQAAIYRNIIQLSGLVILIISVSVVAIYLTLTKL